MFKYIKPFILTFIAIIVIALSFCVIAYRLPSNNNNAKESLEIIANEGLYPKIGGIYALIQDNFTDGLMYNIAISGDSLSSLDGAMLNPVSYIDDTEYSYCDAAIHRLDNMSNISTWNYGRYWHGYLFPLKSLNLSFSLHGIRIINTILLWGLFLTCCILLYKIGGAKLSICFFVSILSVGFIIVPSCLQFCSCFYITFTAMICILCIPSISSNNLTGSLFFFIIGCATCYFDLLSTPALTLGFPLVTASMLDGNNTRFNKIIAKCVAWSIGYISLWATKWILATYITDYDFISDAFLAVENRSLYSIVSSENAFMFNATIAFIFIIMSIFAILSSYYIGLLRHHKPGPKYLLFISFIPILGYLIMLNHTIIHLWFAYRSISISIFCSLLFIFDDKLYSKMMKSKNEILINRR